MEVEATAGMSRRPHWHVSGGKHVDGGGRCRGVSDAERMAQPGRDGTGRLSISRGRRGGNDHAVASPAATVDVSDYAMFPPL